MTTLWVALALTAPAVRQDVNPAALVGKMLAYYNDAASMTGRITMTVSAGGDSANIDTVLQFEAPSKIYVRQQKSSGDRRVWLLVSDGKRFAYDSPGLPGETKPTRLVEAVSPDKATTLTFRDIYAAGSATLGDRSAPLDIAIGRREDLGFLRNQWANISYRGKTKFNEEEVHVVMGDWRPYGDAATVGQYRMYITEAGELRQFARSETLRPTPTSNPVEILSTWTVRLTKNGKPDAALFANPR